MNAAFRNKDGFGYAYVHNDHTVIKKFLDWTEMAEKYYKDVELHPKSVFLLHWRWATNGKISIKNSHPFALSQGGALIHNGVLRIEGMPTETSDSRFLVNNIINRFPQGWESQPWWVDVLEKYIGTNNKLAMLFDDGGYMIVNERLGHWKNPNDGTRTGGIWYSNYSYDDYKVPSRTRPVVPSNTNAYSPYIVKNETEADDYPGVIDLEEWWTKHYAEKEEQDAVDPDAEACCAVGTCEDCFEDLIPGEDHVCDIPAFVLAQIRDYRRETERRPGREIVPYGRID